MRAAAMTAVAAVALLAPGTARADDKNGYLALGLSAGGTVVGGYLLSTFATEEEPRPYKVVSSAAILVAAPSFGHVYTGDYVLALGGTGLRVAGLAMMYIGAGDCTDETDRSGDCIRTNENETLFVAGLLVVAGSALAEIIDAPLAARRHNAGHAAMTIVPTGDGKSYGAAVVGRF